ncbi:MAG: aldehyde-activating protein [Hirschia sp.]|nr:aldehyde-activating protein [Hirschia sp.]MBF17981.1 aldehyde-activating protein [Hirschia sp.]|tara:strand:- start:6698 stop:7114 length:417 start_codon:yes stop_codon:yes gene_type:complete
MSQDANPALKICAGGCHCGNVRFEVLLPNEIVVESCNCSICFKTGNAHIIVPTSRFSLKAGTSALTEYRFNTGVAQHLFCSNCGVTSFYIPRSNPDGVAVTHACLDRPDDFEKISVNLFDGQNWEANAGALASRSIPD